MFSICVLMKQIKSENNGKHLYDCCPGTQLTCYMLITLKYYCLVCREIFSTSFPWPIKISKCFLLYYINIWLRISFRISRYYIIMCSYTKCDKFEKINKPTMIISLTINVIVVLLSNASFTNGAGSIVAKTSERLISPLCVENGIRPKIFR